MASHREVDGIGDLRLVGDVARDEFGPRAEVLGCLTARLGVDVGEDDGCGALAEELRGGGLAEAVCSAGDQSDLSM